MGYLSQAQGRRKGGGARGTCPSEIATLKFFCLNSMEFVTFNEIFSIFFVFGDFTPDLTEGSVRVWTSLVTEPTLLSHSETNSWIRPWSGTTFKFLYGCLISSKSKARDRWTDAMQHLTRSPGRATQ